MTKADPAASGPAAEPATSAEEAQDQSSDAELRRFYRQVDLRMDRPTPARMYDYFLGGKDNFAIDREAGEAVVELIGEQSARQGPLENRAFLRRAVRWMAQQGIDQFIDLGAGLPTQGNVHEVAQSVNPNAHIVYVDNDPIVLAHGRALLTNSTGVEVITADLRHPDDVRKHSATQQLIDFSRPVGLLLFAVLHFIPDTEKPRELLDAYLAQLAPGSVIGISHITMDGFETESISDAAAIYRRATSPMVPRSRAQIAHLLENVELVEPGLVRSWQWRPDGEDGLQTNATYGAVGRVTA
jgi:hypothetical protein